MISKNKFKKGVLFMLVVFMNTYLSAQNEVIELWKKGVPNSIKATDYEEFHDEKMDRVGKVSNPTLTVFVPKNPNRTSVVICPGGGYQFLAINKEGYKTAEWFNSLGITAFVLKYRLPSDVIMENKSVGPLQDAQESVRFIRRNASKWNLNPAKIGILGYSAGGHLAASLSTKYNEVVYQNSDSISAKPNFSLLIYPVISMTNDITHKGSRNNLLGKLASDEFIEQFSTEKLINAETPTTFLVHAIDDKSVPVENSINYFLGLKKHNVISEMHLYQKGSHGFGLGKDGTSSFWTSHCEKWLQLNQFIN
ncbi:MAG: alpha/beta hydrolase [Polaribacter sp.]|uniref:alpha/beta hydrolase n=1 Tax=Polaribacter sp. TaxID=1920175 RepID=UPI003BAFC679